MSIQLIKAPYYVQLAIPYWWNVSNSPVIWWSLPFVIFGYRAGIHWYESALYTWFTISLNTFTNENIFLKKGGVAKLFFIEIIHI